MKGELRFENGANLFLLNKHIEGAMIEDVEGKYNSEPSYSPLFNSDLVKQGFIL